MGNNRTLSSRGKQEGYVPAAHMIEYQIAKYVFGSSAFVKWQIYPIDFIFHKSCEIYANIHVII